MFLPIEFETLKSIVTDFDQIAIDLFEKKNVFTRINLALGKLTDITAIDLFEKMHRIQINYTFATINTILIRINIPMSKLIETISNTFKIASILEREIYEFFGIIFYKHMDLRKLLLDYTFLGNPGLKNYPTPGYIQLQFSAKKKLVFLPVVLSQEFRIFEYSHPWGEFININNDR